MAAKSGSQRSREARKPKKGNDILSKMLQMEKQSLQQRKCGASPTPPTSQRPRPESTLPLVKTPVRSCNPSNTLKKQQPQTSQPMRPSAMPRSQTLPAMIEASGRKPQAPLLTELKLDAASDAGDTEICQSPTWSDHGEKEKRQERKRREKEQKALEKALQPPPKRLSKLPPPAAMETQRMPYPLRSSSRRSSFTSLLSSRPSSRERTSTDERRLSTSSLMSFIKRDRSRSRSRRTSVTDDEDKYKPGYIQDDASQSSVVDPVAPTLPNFPWRSNKNSPSESPTRGFLETTLTSVDQAATNSQSANANSRSSYINHRGPANAPVLASIRPDNRRVRPAPRQAETVDITRARKSTLSSEQQAAPVANNMPKDQPRNSDEVAAELLELLDNQMRQSKASSQADRIKHQRNLSDDGNTYVHRQRMYRQQRSIAGFEEQQTIQLASEQVVVETQEVSRDQSPSMNSRKTLQEDIEKATAVSSSFKEDFGKTMPEPEVGQRKRHSSASPSRQPSLPPTSRAHTQPPPSPLRGVMQPPEQEPQAHQLRRAGQPIGRTKIVPQAVSDKVDKLSGLRKRLRPPSISIPKSNAGQQPRDDTASKKDESLKREPSQTKSRRESFSKQLSFRPRRDSSSARLAQADQLRKIVKPAPAPASAQAGPEAVITRVERKISQPAPMTAVDSKSATKESQKMITPAPFAPLPILKSSTPKDESKFETMSKHSHTSSQDSVELAAEYSRLIHEPSPVDTAPKYSFKEENGPSQIDTAPRYELKDEIERKPSIKEAEVVVEGVNGDGIVRRTSITRHRSNPLLQTKPTAEGPLAAADFLPKLKHQPLVKPPRRLSTEKSSDSTQITASKFQAPAQGALPSTEYKSPLAGTGGPDLTPLPRSPLRPPNLPLPSPMNRSAPSIAGPGSSLTSNKSGLGGSGSFGAGLSQAPIAKLFVVCCKCKFWHDLPSKLYESMAVAPKGKRNSMTDGEGASGPVKCPWCTHAMTTLCCAGYTTCIYIHERHH